MTFQICQHDHVSYDKVSEHGMHFYLVKNLIFTIITLLSCESYTSFL